MKTFLKLLVAIIIAIIILAGVMFLIDCSSVKSGNIPVFAKEIGVLNDGGTIEYTGVGYKIIDFNRLNGYDETKIGLWFMKYEDFKDEYRKFDNKLLDEPIITEDRVSGDIENNDIIDEVVSSGDITLDIEESGDIIEVEDNNVSGDISEIENNIVSGDTIESEPIVEITENENYYFDAVILGISSNNMVVQPLENEQINNSSDMFSFSIENQNSEIYLIGQKVRIEYTGSIRETYPAQIDVISIEILE